MFHSYSLGKWNAPICYRIAQKILFVAVLMLGIGSTLLANYSPYFVGPVTGPSTMISSFNPLDPALGFSVFIEGDAELIDTETEGSVAIGGNLEYFENAYVVAPPIANPYTVPGDPHPVGSRATKRDKGGKLVR